jgi:hypothetical protein
MLNRVSFTTDLLMATYEMGREGNNEMGREGNNEMGREGNNEMDVKKRGWVSQWSPVLSHTAFGYGKNSEAMNNVT